MKNNNVLFSIIAGVLGGLVFAMLIGVFFYEKPTIPHANQSALYVSTLEKNVRGRGGYLMEDGISTKQLNIKAGV